MCFLLLHLFYNIRYFQIQIDVVLIDELVTSFRRKNGLKKVKKCVKYSLQPCLTHAEQKTV